MIAVTTAPAPAFPLLPTTGPKDWAGMPRATGSYGARPSTPPTGTPTPGKPTKPMTPGYLGYPIDFYGVDALKGRPTFLKAEGATTVAGAVAAALLASIEIQRGRGTQFTPLVAVLQAKDGAFYITPLTREPGKDATKYLIQNVDVIVQHPNDNDDVTIARTSPLSTVLPRVDALKAIVFGTSWVRFPEAAAGSNAKRMPVPQTVTGSTRTETSSGL